ncbi:MAG: hypothetical protein MHM6MM_001396 [Cercozoa sp. M6MM]
MISDDAVVGFSPNAFQLPNALQLQEMYLETPDQMRKVSRNARTRVEKKGLMHGKRKTTKWSKRTWSDKHHKRDVFPTIARNHSIWSRILGKEVPIKFISTTALRELSRFAENLDMYLLNQPPKNLGPAGLEMRHRLVKHLLVFMESKRLPEQGAPVIAKKEADRILKEAKEGPLFKEKRVGIAPIPKDEEMVWKMKRAFNTTLSPQQRAKRLFEEAHAKFEQTGQVEPTFVPVKKMPFAVEDSEADRLVKAFVQETQALTPIDYSDMPMETRYKKRRAIVHERVHQTDDGAELLRKLRDMDRAYCQKHYGQQLRIPVAAVPL